MGRPMIAGVRRWCTVNGAGGADGEAGGAALAAPEMARLQAEARRHLWMHFTRLGAYRDAEIPLFIKGTGVRLFDGHGRSWLDGLAGLFVVQAGHGRADLAEAGRRQAQQLAYYPIWSAAHPAAIELATRLAALAPGDLNRVFFTTGGSEAVESGLEAGARLLQGDRPTAAHQGGGAPSRLPRHHARRPGHHRCGVAAHPVPAARARGGPRRQHQPLPLGVRPRRDGGRRALQCGVRRGHRTGHPRRGARDRGRRVPRAPAEHRRMLPAAPGVLRPRPRHLRPLRRPARLRRGDLRLRAAGPRGSGRSATGTSPTCSPSPKG